MFSPLFIQRYFSVPQFKARCLPQMQQCKQWWLRRAHIKMWSLIVLICAYGHWHSYWTLLGSQHRTLQLVFFCSSYTDVHRALASVTNPFFCKMRTKIAAECGEMILEFGMSTINCGFCEVTLTSSQWSICQRSTKPKPGHSKWRNSKPQVFKACTQWLGLLFGSG